VTAIHPIADIFPPMSADEYAALVQDIRERGLLESVWLYEGQVLDGRHRSRACQELGIEPETREYEGDDPLGFVVSLNLKRRHLSESQRAMVASRIANLKDGQTARSANWRTSEPAVSQPDAARMLNVSERSVQRAEKIERDAIPEVTKAVERGEVSLHAAVQIAEFPEEVQEEIIEEVQQGAKAPEVIKKHVHVAQNSGENEWYTPARIIELAREVMGAIDTDPASSAIANETVGAATFFTATDNGLEQTWSGNVWMNPPYSQPLIAQFSDAVARKFQEGEIEQACVLVNNATETSWFHTLASCASAVCFPRSRIRFVDPEGKPSGAPLQGQAILYMGKHRDKFCDAFASLGLIWVAR